MPVECLVRSHPVSDLAARIPSGRKVASYLTWRRLPTLLASGLVLFALGYILFLAKTTPDSGVTNWRTTTFGSAVHDPSSFLKVALDSITFAAALFIVASGFALIFGLMRVVNMAHGSFYLLGGYIAYEIQQGMAGQGFSIDSARVSTWDWLVPLAVAAPCIAIVGLVIQQAFLRWNQGQEMRQALITIAISVIIADQIIAHFPRNVSGTQRFGGNAVDLTWPGWTDRFVNLHVGGVQYSLARFVMLAIGVSVGGQVSGATIPLIRWTISSPLRSGAWAWAVACGVGCLPCSLPLDQHFGFFPRHLYNTSSCRCWRPSAQPERQHEPTPLNAITPTRRFNAPRSALCWRAHAACRRTWIRPGRDRHSE